MSGMARNEERRRLLTDAGLSLLAEVGARGLTHRAVDHAAGVPQGTASNYFPRRNELITALVRRISERLTPDPTAVSVPAGKAPDRDLFLAYVRDVLDRLTKNSDVTLALFELRLEAARRPEVAEALGAWRQGAFGEDISFNETAGLPGGKTEIALLHFAIDGLMLDRLTVPLDTGLSAEAAVEELVSRILR